MHAIELRPNRDAYGNLGNPAFNLDALDVAIDANRRALELHPTCAEAHSNLGWVCHAAGRDAIVAFESAIDLQPDFAVARLNLALSLLVCGDFAGGWREYTWVWRVQVRSAHPHVDHVTL